ncbi:unnamed protein product [Orchesella dallaii]|uniref:DM13 domain-containing protein n=1 Tax=Orchesella dallaii TaxID=48710 RepID=A0ABP1QL68_9HEXA
MGKFRMFWTLISIIVLVVEPSLQDDMMIGDLSSCGHDLKGTVWATNKRQIVIKGFHYDGKGPGTYFTAMKKGQTKIHPQGDNFVLIPHTGATDPCDVVSWGKAITGENIMLDLPVDIGDLETIGVYCHQFCANFGHIQIPKDLSALPDPATDVTVPSICTPKDHFKKPASDGLNCAEEKNLKNTKMDACDPPKTGDKTGDKSGAVQFQPNFLMSIAAAVFFGLISQYPSK